MFESISEYCIQTDAFRLHERTLEMDGPAASAPSRRYEIRIVERVVGGLGEEAAISAIKVALRRQTFREQDVMRIELDMPVSDIGHCLSPDGGAVDQAEDRHERLASIGRLDQDGVAG